MFETEYKKLRGLIFIGLLMLLALSFAQLGQIIALHQIDKSQDSLIEALKQANINAGALIKVLKIWPPQPPPSPPSFKVNPQLRPEPSPSPGRPT